MWNHTDFSELHDYYEEGIVEVTSEYEFFDVFLFFREKFSMNIPDTVIMKKGRKRK